MNTCPRWGAYARNFNLATLDYHAQSAPGKLAIVATKPMDTQRDLALAYWGDSGVPGDHRQPPISGEPATADDAPPIPFLSDHQNGAGTLYSDISSALVGWHRIPFAMTVALRWRQLTPQLTDHFVALGIIQYISKPQ